MFYHNERIRIYPYRIFIFEKKGMVTTMRKNLQRVLVLLLIMTLIAGILPDSREVFAADKPAKPKITVKASKDGDSVTVTIKKTSGAAGYQIEAKMPGSKKYSVVRTLEKNGKKKRSITVDTLLNGKYSFRVKACASDGKSTVWSKYSKVKTITVNNGFDAASLNIKPGDIVTFGACDQDRKSDNGKEPIDWIVLSNSNGKLFMVSVYALEKGIIDDDDDDEDEEDEDDEEDDGFYHGTTNSDFNEFDGTWKNSKIRKHLNEAFLTEAFSEKEISFIADTELTDAGCTDKVFLLSKDEIESSKLGFERQEDRICAPASPALRIWVYNGWGDYGYIYRANENRSSCYWWLRTPVKSEESWEKRFYLVNRDGSLGTNECWGDDYDTGTGYDMEPSTYIENGEFGIRPAIVLKLKNGVQDVLTKTGKTMKEEWAGAGFSGTHNTYDDSDDE